MDIKTKFNIDDEVTVMSYANLPECRGKVSSYEYNRNGLWANVIVFRGGENQMIPTKIHVPESFLS